MGITADFELLHDANERLVASSEAIDGLTERVDAALADLGIGVEYVHARPLAESVRYGRDGKRSIELCYLVYTELEGRRRLAIKTIVILESKVAMDWTQPGRTVPLSRAPVRLRQEAVDQLPEVVNGMMRYMEALAGRAEKRCEVAASVLRVLESKPREATGRPRRTAPQPLYPSLRRDTGAPGSVTRNGH